MHWDVGSWVWFGGIGLGIVVLGLALGYGTAMWRRARQAQIPGPGREAATREVYRQEERMNKADRSSSSR